MTAIAKSFSARLLAWYDQHGRKDLPWQIDASPYRVWVSETMLQQTQVATVVDYFNRFMDRFPTIDALAGAELDDVLHFWSGLGYYARARNLYAAAQKIVREYESVLPGSVEGLMALPGIGRSTAGAILALSVGQRVAILDGNVKRVLARYHAIDGWPGRKPVEKKLWERAESHIPETRLRDYTQALMDLGATVCRRKPECGACPLASDCIAFAAGDPADYPGRKPVTVRGERRLDMIVARRPDGSVWLEKRPAKGIWGGLWSFPELTDGDDPETWCERRIGCRVSSASRSDTIKHELTHLSMKIRPWLVELAADEVRDVKAASMDDPPAVWYNSAAPQQLGLAAPVSAMLKRFGPEKEHDA